MASIEKVLDELKKKIADMALENALLTSELEEIRSAQNQAVAEVVEESE